MKKLILELDFQYYYKFDRPNHSKNEIQIRYLKYQLIIQRKYFENYCLKMLKMYYFQDNTQQYMPFQLLLLLNFERYLIINLNWLT